MKGLNQEFVYKTLTKVFKNHEIGVSKGTLDRWDFKIPFENNQCIIKKFPLV